MANKNKQATNKKDTPTSEPSNNSILDMSTVKRYVPKDKVPKSLSTNDTTVLVNQAKTPKSVLCFIPPEDAWERIQVIRNQYANGRYRNKVTLTMKSCKMAPTTHLFIVSLCPM